jgi:hypothetical protein
LLVLLSNSDLRTWKLQNRSWGYLGYESLYFPFCCLDHSSPTFHLFVRQHTSSLWLLISRCSKSENVAKVDCAPEDWLDWLTDWLNACYSLTSLHKIIQGFHGSSYGT